ncbi:MAG: hypothetical protein NTX53_00815 [candidate division WOR-3 bacterium]|nr:hypothetical protein [candidate division WOR-3 bacterium]
MSKVLRQLPEQSVRSVLKGCRKYERTLVNGQNPRRSDGNVRAQFDRFSAAMEEEAVLTTRVRQVLCRNGILSCRFMPYFNFAMHVAKLVRSDLGERLPIYVAVAIGRWTARGQQMAVLEQIRSDVFNIGPVDPPGGPDV